MLLDRIKSPEDLKKFEIDELPQLADEIRFEILKSILQNGGHLASNLGVVELTIALHYCFDMLEDRLVFDVGHQCYPHKILTGRRERFSSIRKKGGLSGFPFPPESKYDVFHTGHAGTSISLGLGLALWSKITKNNDKRVVALIGDASLGSGVALEALNWAGQQGSDMLIVLNDNEMSITRTVGALARYLSSIRIGPFYKGLKKELQNLVAKLPIIGEKMDKGISDLIKTLKNTLVPGQLFEEFGCTYYGPVAGHDLPRLIDTFNELRDFKGLCLLHVLTEKGKGYENAVEDPESFHGVSPSVVEVEEGKDGKLRVKFDHSNGNKSHGVSYTSLFGSTLLEEAEKDDRIVAITAAMPEGTGLKKFGATYPDRYFDTGITEQHAVAFAGGLARAGAKPVVAIYSTFIQRCYDQIFQEICLQNHDVLLALDRGGVVGQDGPTHHGLYDITFLRALPRMTLMSPKDGDEFQEMLRFALKWKGPKAIRYPRGTAERGGLSKVPIEHGRGELVTNGEDVLIIAYGPMVLESLEAMGMLAGDRIYPALINARFAKPLDRDIILRNMVNKRLVVTVEEHALAGGFGSSVAELLTESDFKGSTIRLGVEDLFVDHGTRMELFKLLHLDAGAIAGRIREWVNENTKKGPHTRGWAAIKDQEVL